MINKQDKQNESMQVREKSRSLWISIKWSTYHHISQPALQASPSKPAVLSPSPCLICFLSLSFTLCVCFVFAIAVFGCLGNCCDEICRYILLLMGRWIWLLEGIGFWRVRKLNLGVWVRVSGVKDSPHSTLPPCARCPFSAYFGAFLYSFCLKINQYTFFNNIYWNYYKT